MTAPHPPLRLRALQHAPYAPTLAAMQALTATRQPDRADEIWLVEHPPVYTQGLAGKPEHVLCPGDIPVIKTDRGGQVTYHGPGQVVAYTLIDLRRQRLTVRQMVCQLEAAAIATCAALGVATVRKQGAPGVYVATADGLAGAKIAALGLKLQRGCSYHGLALNVNMDLSPFERIHPCGYAGQPVTDLARAGAAANRPLSALSLATVAEHLGATLAASFQSP